MTDILFWKCLNMESVIFICSAALDNLFSLICLNYLVQEVSDY